jgi:hypothetical protein
MLCPEVTLVYQIRGVKDALLSTAAARAGAASPLFSLQSPQPIQDLLKNADLERVQYMQGLFLDDGAALNSLRKEFAAARKFAQCLVVIHENLQQPDASGSMPRLQNVQVIKYLPFPVFTKPQTRCKDCPVSCFFNYGLCIFCFEDCSRYVAFCCGLPSSLRLSEACMVFRTQRQQRADLVADCQLVYAAG